MSFNFSGDQTSNAFTSQASKDSATVSWDESEDGSQKVINITGQSTSLTEKLFDKNKNEEYLVETNAVNVTDLSPGTKTNVEIFTVGENQDKNGESIKTTISTGKLYLHCIYEINENINSLRSFL